MFLGTRTPLRHAPALDTISDPSNSIQMQAFRIGEQIIITSGINNGIYRISAFSPGLVTLSSGDQLTNDVSQGVIFSRPAGFTATGTPLDIDDRVGGTVQVLGAVGHPVVLTSIFDDSVGAGFTPSGRVLLDTNNDGLDVDANGTDDLTGAAVAGVPSPGDWRGIFLDKFSNDRNVRTVDELERAFYGWRRCESNSHGCAAARDAGT